MGLANLRGMVIPVIDLRVMLRKAAFVQDPAARAIVLTGAPIALVVDMVDTLVSVEADQVEIRQGATVAEAEEILLGIFPAGPVATETSDAGAEQNVIRILDLPAMLGRAFGDRPAPRTGARTTTTSPAREETGTAASVERRLLICFDVAGQEYAMSLDAVREIIPLPATIAIVPRAEAVLLGVASWRDRLLPLLSLRGLLGFAQSTAWTGREKVLVTTVNGAVIGLVADRAQALIRADVSAIDPAPAMLAARSGGESRIAAIFRDKGGGKLVSLLAPERLLREDVMRHIGDSLAQPISATGASAMAATVQFVVFRLGDEEFGLPIDAVDEVARVPRQITRVPKMPKFLEGVINLRGEVLPIIDQRRRFDMPEFGSGGSQRLIVVRTERHRAGLIVDSVSEVLRTESTAIEPAPDLTGRLINGVVNQRITVNKRISSRMILLLDPAELLTGSEQGALDQLELREADAEAEMVLGSNEPGDL
jgi:purine-binding chemotaxis protein CheW